MICPLDATLLVDARPQPAADDTWLVRALLTVSAAPPPPVAGAPARLPLTVALVLDRSGSMAGAPLDAARRAAAGLVRRLRPEDTVAVVAYDDQVTTVAEPATGAAQGALARAIERITDGGSTNLSGGWLRGRELVDQARGTRAALDVATGTPSAADAPGASRIVLLTDGLANVGITDPAMLVRLCAVARAAGVTTTTVGFGAGYDERLLRAMADAGGGNSYYVEHPDQAPDVFAEEVEGLLTLGAQNVRVIVRARGATNAGARVVAVRVRHDWPGTRDAHSATLELGDVYAREPKAVLVDLVVRGASTDDTGSNAPTGVLAECLVQAQVVGADGGVEQVAFTLPIATDGARRAEPAIVREAMLLDAAAAREAAVRAHAAGDHAAGALVLREAAYDLADVAGSVAAAPFAAELTGESDDLRAMAVAFEAERVSAADAKYLGQMAYANQRGKARSKARLRRSE